MDPPTVFLCAPSPPEVRATSLHMLKVLASLEPAPTFEGIALVLISVLVNALASCNFDSVGMRSAALEFLYEETHKALDQLDEYDRSIGSRA
jgi:hypothetical protein